MTLYTGSSSTSFGELIQINDHPNRCLLSLPVNLRSQAHLRIDINPRSSSQICLAKLHKSRAVMEYLLPRFIKTGFLAELNIVSSIPQGKGISSSTADMNATLNAIQLATSTSISDSLKSKIFSLVEPHDPVHLRGCTLYDPDKGSVIQSLGYTPKATLLCFDFGGSIDTIEQRQKSHRSSTTLLAKYELLELMKQSLRAKDSATLFRLSTKAAILESLENPYWRQLRLDFQELVSHFEADGLVLTHSGTCLGLFYLSNTLPPLESQHLTKLKSQYHVKVFTLETIATVHDDDF